MSAGKCHTHVVLVCRFLVVGSWEACSLQRQPDRLLYMILVTDTRKWLPHSFRQVIYMISGNGRNRILLSSLVTVAATLADVAGAMIAVWSWKWYKLKWYELRYLRKRH